MTAWLKLTISNYHHCHRSSCKYIACLKMPVTVILAVVGMKRIYMRKKLIVGNWKMNGSLQANAELLGAIQAAGVEHPVCNVGVAVPAPYLAQACGILQNSGIAVAAQDVSAHDSGAYTGEVSASMLQDFSVRYVLVGHSERRQLHGETDHVVAEKAQAALGKGITPIVCVGETLQEREANQTEQVVKRQLASVIQRVGHCVSELVVAYEPVWAIGTGKTALPEQAQAVHAVLRAQLAAASTQADRIPLLYGGSMNAANAAQLLAQNDIDGGLVGGASLKAVDFLQIIAAAR